MNYLYKFAIFLFHLLVHVMAVFSPKMKLFVNGRKHVFQDLRSSIDKKDKTIWIHCASLGEFEQGRPIIEGLKRTRSEYKIILTFFSPSGYEVRKKYEYADIVTYLPIDSIANAKKFLKYAHPTVAIFVKYEFWPTILKQLHKNSVSTLLVSGIFRPDQLFFKPYGGWMRKSLMTFSHFFVQNEVSKSLLKEINSTNVTISGDTRIDRVCSILDQDNRLDFLDNFTKNKTVLVAGSTWPKDEKYLVNYINNKSTDNERFIIAPHNINDREIQNLKHSLTRKTSLYSEGEIHSETKVFIVDTVGILTKIYSYAQVAYVGGGFDKEGVHNVLEPAVFGIPLVIGPVYDKFDEVKELVSVKGCLVANDADEFDFQLDKLFNETTYRKKLGEANSYYINKNKGATKIILDHIHHIT